MTSIAFTTASVAASNTTKFPTIRPTPDKIVHKLVQYFDEKTQTAIPFDPEKYFFCESRLEKVGDIPNYRTHLMTIHSDGTVGPVYTQTPVCFSFGLKANYDQIDKTKLTGYQQGYVLLNKEPTMQQFAFRSYLDALTAFSRSHFENPDFLFSLGKEAGSINVKDINAYTIKSVADKVTKKFVRKPDVLNAKIMTTKLYGEPDKSDDKQKDDKVKKDAKGNEIKEVIGFNIDTKYYHMNTFETTQTVQPNGIVRTVKKRVSYADPKSTLLNKPCKSMAVIKHEGLYTGAKTTMQQKATEIFVEMRDNEIPSLMGGEEVTEDAMDQSAGFD